MAKKRVLVVFETPWDRRQLAACRAAWDAEYDVLFAPPRDEDCPFDLDLAAALDRLEREYRGRIDGVFSSSDYPGALAAAVLALRLGLPGSPPNGVLRAAHKYKSRVAQARSVPEATPPFVLIDPEQPESPFYPCFVKPIKGSFSAHSRRIECREELAAFLASPGVVEFRRTYPRIFNQALRAFSDITVDAGWFLAEGVLGGRQVTVEAYAHGGAHAVLGIADSVLAEGRPSFVRFDLPSRLAPEVQERLGRTALAIGRQLGLDHGIYNVELFHDPAADRVWIIEVNPRLCGQFADLHEKVSGTNSYRVALDLAAGRAPVSGAGGGCYETASSFPLRTFEPVRVLCAPGQDEIAAAEALSPGTLAWVECERDQELSDFAGLEDGASFRYAVVNVGARDLAGAIELFQMVRARLGIELEPLARRCSGAPRPGHGHAAGG